MYTQPLFVCISTRFDARRPENLARSPRTRRLDSTKNSLGHFKRAARSPANDATEIALDCSFMIWPGDANMPVRPHKFPKDKQKQYPVGNSSDTAKIMRTHIHTGLHYVEPVVTEPYIHNYSQPPLYFAHTTHSYQNILVCTLILTR